VTVTGGWTERTFGEASKPRSAARPARRSLGAALREAGLGEAAPEPRVGDHDRASIAAQLSSALAATRSPRLAVFDGPVDEEHQPEVAEARSARPSTTQTSGVVSPPPWLRAARRGRWQTRLANTFGWVMALAVAGTIIGLASHVLGVGPASIQTSMQARQ